MISDVTAGSGMVSLLWEGHDRHPTTARLPLIGVPLTVLSAVVGLHRVDLHGPIHYP